MSDILKLKENKSLDDISQIKSELFGKNGKITNEFKKISNISSDERKKFASELNSVKDEIQTLIEKKIKNFEIEQINSRLQSEKVDVTLPERSFVQGKIHPVSQVIDEISSIFSEIGFSVAEGPDVETEYNNFTALNLSLIHI